MKRCALTLLTLATLATLGRSDEPLSRHVIIISIDGLRPDALQTSAAPNIHQTTERASYSWSAQTIFPSETTPSHTSMLTGLSPEKHGVLSNHWYSRRPYVDCDTIFSLAHREKLKTAMFVGKAKFIHLAKPGSLDHYLYPKATKRNSETTAWFDQQFRRRWWPWAGAADSVTVARAAAKYLTTELPNLMFVHLTDPDVVGHNQGWMTQAQRVAIHQTDIAVGLLLDAIERHPDLNDTVVILTADHGGHDRTHGSRRTVDMTIPWIAWGDCIAPNHKIQQPITTYDTGATALHLLGVPLPNNFDGKPVGEIFVPVAQPSAIATN